MERGTSWWPASDGAPPLHATRRNPLLRTDGPQVGVIAEALGTPFIPWQRYVADVAGERRPDGSYEYEIVIVSVPRQTGKTTLVRAEGVHTCLVCGRDFFYTAQTGKDARERWTDLVKILRTNPALRDRIKIALRGGSEHVQFLDPYDDPLGAFRCFAPTPESLHGYTPPKVCVDEAFAQTDGRGELLMGAIGPAQITIIDKQIWIVSTMGTAESVWFHDWVERGIAGMPRVAVFVWGCPDELDPFNVDHIARFHPGVGFELNSKVLTAEDVLAQADRHSRAEYERAFGNRATLTTAHLIAPETWRALGPQDAQPFPDLPNLDQVTITYDVAADRSAAAIAASWPLDDGRIAGQLLAAGPGLTWLADAVDRLDSYAALVAVGHGPVLEVTDDLVRRGHDVTTLNEREFATASGHLLTLIETAGLLHDGSTVLARSVTGLVTRAGVVDGVAFSRRHSVGDSSPGVALAVGLWHAGRVDTRKPLIYFGT